MFVLETNSRVEKYVTLSIFQDKSKWQHESSVDFRVSLSKKRPSDPNEIVKKKFFWKKLWKIMAWLAAISVHVWRHSTQQRIVRGKSGQEGRIGIIITLFFCPVVHLQIYQ